MSGRVCLLVSWARAHGRPTCLAPCAARPAAVTARLFGARASVLQIRASHRFWRELLSSFLMVKGRGPVPTVPTPQNVIGLFQRT